MKKDIDLLSTLVADISSSFSTESDKQTFVDDWYFARAFMTSSYMMEKMCRVDHDGNITKPLCLTLEGTSSKMRAVLRELILRAHYIDFDEQNGDNASEITILYDDSEEAAKRTLLGTPFLAGYLHHLWEEPLDFLDFKIHFLPKSAHSRIDVSERILADFPYTRSNTIDTRAAEYANRIYCLGGDLSNLPSIDTSNAEMYELPLRVFETENYRYDRSESWEGNSVKNKLSNVFCTDTFALRKMMLERGMNREGAKERTLVESVRKNILPLSKCEHSRWVAEKLIFDFRPWTPMEHYQYDRLFGEAKKRYYASLKRKEAHYNICSYRSLMRLDPANLKYDTFLVLAMLEIIKKAEKSEDE